MSKQKEWQYFTEVRDGLKVKHLTENEVIMYKYGLHIFAGVMLLIVLAIHVKMKKNEKKRKQFDYLGKAE